jgi:YidC/Oxa1 family membrane protein insertase
MCTKGFFPLTLPASLILAVNPFGWFFDPLVLGLDYLLGSIHGLVHNYGWSIILLAGLVKAALWPLSSMQLRSMAAMQKLTPQIQALKEKYKGKDADSQQKLNAETMTLYKEHNVNPMAGCLPALIPIPIMIAFWQAIMHDRQELSKASWLWIGSPLAHTVPKVFGTSLASADLVLLGMYMISMFFTMRTATPPMDEKQAEQQKMMSFLSPAMLGYFGWRNAWPSALVLYWLTFNLFSMGQQIWVQRRFLGAPIARDDKGSVGIALGVPVGEKSKERMPSLPTAKPNARNARKKRSRR